MKCPACRKPLVVVEREGIEVDWCPACHGVWFDAGELEILAEKAGKRLEPGMIGEPVADTAEARRRCPRCRHKMEKITPDGDDLLLDRCLEHGLWFDADELPALLGRLSEREGEEAAVIGFLNETFSPPPAGGKPLASKESGT